MARRTSLGNLQRAYEHFNERLFRGMLPPSLLTFQRRRGSDGSFSVRRFAELEPGEVMYEISLNPADLDAETLLVHLVHQMVHLWQYHFAQRPRTFYHDREWARRMTELGLQPSDTGRPGGKTTGQRMSQYILPDEPFELACRELLATLSAEERKPWLPARTARPYGPGPRPQPSRP